ncbi:hypothetical protein [Pseudomonas putida]|uniref:hypothetical protein n=1 Tax=Pseudomonas putida TaxID=303 RepID=UPI0021196F09
MYDALHLISSLLSGKQHKDHAGRWRQLLAATQLIPLAVRRRQTLGKPRQIMSDLTQRIGASNPFRQPCDQHRSGSVAGCDLLFKLVGYWSQKRQIRVQIGNLIDQGILPLSDPDDCWL